MFTFELYQSVKHYVIFNLLLLLYTLLVYDLFVTILIPWKRNKVLEVHILFLRILVAFVPYSILLSLAFKAVNAPILADPNAFYYPLVQSGYNAHCYLLPCLPCFCWAISFHLPTLLLGEMLPFFMVQFMKLALISHPNPNFHMLCISPREVTFT